MIKLLLILPTLVFVAILFFEIAHAQTGGFGELILINKFMESLERAGTAPELALIVLGASYSIITYPISSWREKWDAEAAERRSEIASVKIEIKEKNIDGETAHKYLLKAHSDKDIGIFFGLKPIGPLIVQMILIIALLRSASDTFRERQGSDIYFLSMNIDIYNLAITDYFLYYFLISFGILFFLGYSKEVRANLDRL